MRLYHFTAPYHDGHLGAILSDGAIGTTESNVSRTIERRGPDVVWLTDNPDPAVHGGWSAGMTPYSFLKTWGRITVEVPFEDVLRWAAFVKKHRMPVDWARQLASVGGSGTWYVAPNPIDRAAWVCVEHRLSGAWERVETPVDLPSLKRALQMAERVKVG